MDKMARGFLALTFSLMCAVPVFAGIADSPLPVLVVGQTTFHLYSVPGVVNDSGRSVATFFACTSTSTSSMVVGIEIFGAGGGSPVNNATTTAATLAAGGTVVLGTMSALGVHVDV